MQFCYVTALTASATAEKSLDQNSLGKSTVIPDLFSINPPIDKHKYSSVIQAGRIRNTRFCFLGLSLTHCLIFVIHLPHSPTYKMCIITGKLWGLNDSCLCKAFWSSDKNCFRIAKYYHKLELYFSVTIDYISDGSASTALRNLPLEINFLEYKYPTLYYPNH